MAFADWLLIKKDITASTNDDARDLIQQGIIEKTVVVAEQQTQGRGRQQRVWQSEPGNLFGSFIVAPQLPIKDFPLYTFAAALAVRTTMQHFLPEQTVQVKWPNDVLVNKKKIAGILIEVENNSLIIGIGVNCVHYPDNALFPATSLKDNGADIAPKAVLKNLAQCLDQYTQVLEKYGFEPLRTEWFIHAYKKNETITIQQNDQTIAGVLTGIDTDGALILRTPNGILRIHSGDLMKDHNAACN